MIKGRIFIVCRRWYQMSTGRTYNSFIVTAYRGEDEVTFKVHNVAERVCNLEVLKMLREMGIAEKYDTFKTLKSDWEIEEWDFNVDRRKDLFIHQDGWVLDDEDTPAWKEYKKRKEVSKNGQKRTKI